MTREVRVAGNLFIRNMNFDNKGDIVIGHKHNFDHMSYVRKGSVLAKSLNEDGSINRTIIKRSIDKNNYLLIKAGIIHEFEALEDNTMVDCVYSHRNPQGDIVLDYDGWHYGYE